MNTFCDEYIIINHQYLKTKLDSMPSFHFGMHGGKRTIRVSIKGSNGKRIRYESIQGGRRYKEYSDQMAEREKLSKQTDYFDHELKKRRLIVPENISVCPPNTKFTAKLWSEMTTGLNELGKGKGYYDNHMNNVDSRGEMLIIVGNRDYLPTVNAVKRWIISFINDLTLDSVLIP